MSYSLKERIITALLLGVTSFMLLSVIYKLLFCSEDWLSISLMWAISYSLGFFVSKTMIEMTAKEGIIQVLLYEVVIILFVALVMSFIIGVIINLSNWDYVVINTCIPFAIALLTNNKWKRA